MSFNGCWEVSVHACARESQCTFWPSTHWPLTLDLSCKFRAFLAFLHGLPKPLTTYLCVVLCASCWKPGSCWPPVKEDPLHHGSDTLTVPLSLSEEDPPPHPPPLPLHTHSHTQLLNHTRFSCGSERTNTMTQSVPGYFLVGRRCKLAHLLGWPLRIHRVWLSSHTPNRSKQTTRFSFSLPPTHTHTWIHTHTHTLAAVCCNVLRPVPAGDLTLTVPRVSQMAAEQNSSKQQAQLMCSFIHCFSWLNNGGRMNPASILGGVHKSRA